MKLLRITAFLLCTQIPLTHAMHGIDHAATNAATNIEIKIPNPNTIIRTASTQLTHVIDNGILKSETMINNSLSKLSEDVLPEFTNKTADAFHGVGTAVTDDACNKFTIAGEKLITQLTHKIAYLGGGAVLGGLGACLFYTGLSRALNPKENTTTREKLHHWGLTAAGTGALVGAGYVTRLALK